MAIWIVAGPSAHVNTTPHGAAFKFCPFAAEHVASAHTFITQNNNETESVQKNRRKIVGGEGTYAQQKHK
jgi:hypothetical protein